MSCDDIIDEDRDQKVCKADLQVGSPGEGGGLGSRRRGNVSGIPANRTEIVDEQLAIDDGGPDVGAARGVDEGRIRIRTGRLDKDQVGAFADFDAADLLIKTERAG